MSKRSGPQKFSEKKQPPLKKAKTSTQSPFETTSISINDLPNEVLVEVMKFLPAYSFVGQQSTQQVSSLWNASAKSLHSRVTFAELIASCHNEQDVINILKDEATFDSLSLAEFLEIVSFHPQLTATLLEDLPAFYEGSLSFEKNRDRAVLGKRDINVAWKMYEEAVQEKRGIIITELASYHLDIAIRVLNEPNIVEKLYSGDLGAIASSHLEIAKQMLNHPSLRRRARLHAPGVINEYVVAQMGEAHLEIAQLILNTPDLLNMLTSDLLANIAAAHPSIAVTILKTPALLDMLNGKDLATIGCKNFDFAKAIFTNQNLIDKLDSQNLHDLGKAHKEIAFLIIGNPNLLERMGNFLFTHMVGNHADVIRHVLATPSLVTRLHPHEIGPMWENDEGIALELLRTQGLCPNKVSIAHKHKRCASFIINDPSLLSSLARYDLGEILRPYPDLAKAFLSNQANWDMLDTRSLVMIAQHNEDNANYILSNPELYEELEAEELAQIGSSFLASAVLILKNEQFAELLSGAELATIGHAFHEAAKIIFTTESLATKLDADDLAKLGSKSRENAQLVMASPYADKLSTKHLETMSGLPQRVVPFFFKQALENPEIKWVDSDTSRRGRIDCQGKFVDIKKGKVGKIVKQKIAELIKSESTQKVRRSKRLEC
ncbi:MAG: F-box protein [Proteobacteria bacterium]|nr:F-box protein [Pseudomonadota bacterium]